MDMISIYILPSFIPNVHKKKQHPRGVLFLLAMDYEIDILGSFAYDFELLHSFSEIVRLRSR